MILFDKLMASVDCFLYKCFVQNNTELTWATRISLIRRLQTSDDDEAWDDFYAIYYGMISRWAVQMGSTLDQADDICQETALQVYEQLQKGGYDPDKGKFRSYLKTIVHRRVIDSIRKKAAESRSMETLAQDAATPAAQDHNFEDQELDRVWVSSLLLRGYEKTAAKAGETSCRVFEALTIHNRSANDVCQEFGIEKEATLYQQKRRFLKAWAEQVLKLLGQYGDRIVRKKVMQLDESQFVHCLKETVEDILQNNVLQSNEKNNQIFVSGAAG